MKVFGIGLNKTGTTTLGVCCKILGYRVAGCSRGLLKDIHFRQDLSQVLDVVNCHDAFQDWPWPLIYKEMDKRFPGSKFILTVRKDAETWLNSLKHHSYTSKPFNHCRKMTYGYNYPHRHELEHLAFYENHLRQVHEYFQGREQDLLEICWESGDGWDELCNFLGLEQPKIPIPHANKGNKRKVSGHRLLINRILSSCIN